MLEDEQEPSDEWLSHPDNVIIMNAATTVGKDTLTSLLEAREAAGELVRAAYCSFGISLLKGLAQTAVGFDFMYRAQDLLERADDSSAKEFEKAVLGLCWGADMGTERNLKANERAKVLQDNQAEVVLAEGLAAYGLGCVNIGWFGDMAPRDQATFDEACDGVSDLYLSLQKWKDIDAAEAISYFAKNDLSAIERKILSMHKDAVSAIPNIKDVSDAVVSLAKLRDKYFLFLASTFTEAALNVDFPLDGLTISGEGWTSRNNPSVPPGVLQDVDAI